MIERRELLKGMLLAATAGAGTALVKLATPEQVMALKEYGPEVLIGSPMPALPLPEELQLAKPIFIQNAAGEFVQLGFITGMDIHRDMIDISSVHDETTRFMPGMAHVTGTFAVTGNGHS